MRDEGKAGPGSHRAQSHGEKMGDGMPGETPTHPPLESQQALSSAPGRPVCPQGSVQLGRWFSEASGVWWTEPASNPA